MSARVGPIRVPPHNLRQPAGITVAGVRVQTVLIILERIAPALAVRVAYGEKQGAVEVAELMER